MVFQVGIINGLLAAFLPLLQIIFVEKTKMIIGNYSFTVALTGAVLTLSLVSCFMLESFYYHFSN